MIKRLFKIISNLLVSLVVILAILLYGSRFIGLNPYSVLSGSMESVYPTGSLIYVRSVDTDELEVGDVITFRLGGGAVGTHRIIEILDDEESVGGKLFRTKGDENDIADEVPVEAEDVIGTPVFCIPKLGIVGTYISQPPGRYVAITVVAAVMLIEVLACISFDSKEKTTKSKNLNKKGENQ